MSEKIPSMCPDCEEEIPLNEGTTHGEIVVCPSCGVELEIKSIGSEGVVYQYAPKEAEDWGE